MGIVSKNLPQGNNMKLLLVLAMASHAFAQYPPWHPLYNGIYNGGCKREADPAGYRHKKREADPAGYPYKKREAEPAGYPYKKREADPAGYPYKKRDPYEPYRSGYLNINNPISRPVARLY